MNWSAKFGLAVVAAALGSPSVLFAQSAPSSPPIDVLAPPSLPQEPAATPAPPRATTRTAPSPQDPAAPRAMRARAVAPEQTTPPAVTVPGWNPTLSYYTQTAPYYRYSVPLDKEMQELVKKESELTKKTSELVASMKSAADDKKTELRKELLATVEAHFAARQEQRELQLKRIEEEVKKLREAIEKRTASKKEIIDRRIAELTGEDTIGF